MPDHLFILLGAGASVDCASPSVPGVDRSRRPPLTYELFSSEFTNTLRVYPRALAVSSDIQPLAANETFQLEEFLRTQLRDSPHAHRRQQFRAVPLYLQHLLFDASAGYTPNPDNYNRLVSAALDLPEAVFITLNYDTLLDQRLFTYSPLETMNSDIDPGRNWSLIKLHGSVNWGGQVQGEWELQDDDPYLAKTFATFGDDFTVARDPVLRQSPDLRAVRVDGSNSSFGGRLFYPALSTPLGPGDEINCPPDHVVHLADRLKRYDGINLLVIGYSGLDDQVLAMLRNGGNTLRSLVVVSDTRERGEETAARIAQAIGFGSGGIRRTIFTDGFNAFAQSDELQNVIASLP